MKTYYAIYAHSDYGMGLLTVHDEHGRIIGERDPFWPRGIPADSYRRARRLARVAREIIGEITEETRTEFRYL